MTNELDFGTIFVLVLKGTIAYGLIRGVFFAVVRSWFFLRNRNYPSWMGTLDEVWLRQRDEKALIEEIHALLTNKIKPGDISDLRAAMNRRALGSSRGWLERTFSPYKNGEYLREHSQPSEVEDLLEHLDMLSGYKGAPDITKFAALRTAQNREVPWEELASAAGDKFPDRKDRKSKF